MQQQQLSDNSNKDQVQNNKLLDTGCHHKVEQTQLNDNQDFGPIQLEQANQIQDDPLKLQYQNSDNIRNIKQMQYTQQYQNNKLSDKHSNQNQRQNQSQSHYALYSNGINQTNYRQKEASKSDQENLEPEQQLPLFQNHATQKFNVDDVLFSHNDRPLNHVPRYKNGYKVNIDDTATQIKTLNKIYDQKEKGKKPRPVSLKAQQQFSDEQTSYDIQGRGINIQQQFNYEDGKNNNIMNKTQPCLGEKEVQAETSTTTEWRDKNTESNKQQQLDQQKFINENDQSHSQINFGNAVTSNNQIQSQVNMQQNNDVQQNEQINQFSNNNAVKNEFKLKDNLFEQEVALPILDNIDNTDHPKNSLLQQERNQNASTYQVQESLKKMKYQKGAQKIFQAQQSQEQKQQDHIPDHYINPLKKDTKQFLNQREPLSENTTLQDITNANLKTQQQELDSSQQSYNPSTDIDNDFVAIMQNIQQDNMQGQLKDDNQIQSLHDFCSNVESDFVSIMQTIQSGNMQGFKKYDEQIQVVKQNDLDTLSILQQQGQLQQEQQAFSDNTNTDNAINNTNHNWKSIDSNIYYRYLRNLQFAKFYNDKSLDQTNSQTSNFEQETPMLSPQTLSNHELQENNQQLVLVDSTEAQQKLRDNLEAKNEQDFPNMTFRNPKYKDLIYKELSREAQMPQALRARVLGQIEYERGIERGIQSNLPALQRPKIKYPKVQEINPPDIPPSEWASEIRPRLNAVLNFQKVHPRVQAIVLRAIKQHPLLKMLWNQDLLNERIEGLRYLQDSFPGFYYQMALESDSFVLHYDSDFLNDNLTKLINSKYFELCSWPSLCCVAPLILGIPAQVVLDKLNLIEKVHRKSLDMDLPKTYFRVSNLMSLLTWDPQRIYLKIQQYKVYIPPQLLKQSLQKDPTIFNTDFYSIKTVLYVLKMVVANSNLFNLARRKKLEDSQNLEISNSNQVQSYLQKIQFQKEQDNFYKNRQFYSVNKQHHKQQEKLKLVENGIQLSRLDCVNQNESQYSDISRNKDMISLNRIQNEDLQPYNVIDLSNSEIDNKLVKAKFMATFGRAVSIAHPSFTKVQDPLHCIRTKINVPVRTPYTFTLLGVHIVLKISVYTGQAQFQQDQPEFDVLQLVAYHPSILKMRPKEIELRWMSIMVPISSYKYWKIQASKFSVKDVHNIIMQCDHKRCQRLNFLLYRGLHEKNGEAVKIVDQVLMTTLNWNRIHKDFEAWYEMSGGATSKFDRNPSMPQVL